MKFGSALALLTAILALSCDLQAREPGFRIEAEAKTAVERLTGGRADWRTTQVDWQTRNDARQTYYGDLRSTERFSQQDSGFMLGTYQPLGDAWSLQLEAAVSPTHRVLARQSLFAQVERRFEGGWGTAAGFRRSDYARSGTDIGVLTVDRYISSFRAAYSLYLGKPDGAGFNPSHRLQGNYYYTDRSFIGISATSGKEAENIFPTGIQSSRVHGFSISGRHEFAPGWAASYEWLTHQQGDLYTRRGIGLGIRHAF